MLKSIRTKLLFGRFNYNIDFSKNKMTILTGPNGFGKTTILRIIRDVLDDNLYDLAMIPFSEIELNTDDNKSLLFVKEGGSLSLNGEKIFIPLSLGDANPNNIVFTLNSDDMALLRTNYKRYNLPQQVLMIQRVYSSSKDITASTQDYVARINAQILGKSTLKFVDDLLSFYSSLGNSIFCGADRLYRDYTINDGGRSKKKWSDVIGSLSAKLDEVFNYYNQEYTTLSNYLDYSFISKLVSEIELSSAHDNYTEINYYEDTKIIKTKLDKLFGYGFLLSDKYFSDDISFKKEYSLVFKVFTNNFKQKIDALEKLTNKLDLFTEIVNSKIINKTIEVKKDKFGNNIIVKDNNNFIPLQSLSSGEQEIIVLYFKLIFEYKNNLIALIDEPELSSHVSWQYDMLDDFERILSVNESIKQIVVCTHSPQVINDKWEHSIDLFEMSKNNNE